MMQNSTHHQALLEETLKLLKRMLDPEDLGYAVTQEVRDQIKKILNHESIHQQIS
jgi:signal recognition particle GTPase